MPTLKMYPDRRHWLEARLDGIGASDAAAVLGVSRFASPFSLWSEKVARVVDDEEDNEILESGRRAEPMIAEYFEDKVMPKGMILIGLNPMPWIWSPDDPTDSPWRCSPDALMIPDDWCPEERPDMINRVDRTYSPGMIPVQLKNVSMGMLHKWDGEAPLEYQLQVLHEMIVLGAQYGYIVAWIGGMYWRWQRIEWHPKMVDMLLDAEVKFWKLVQDEQPPPADSSNPTARALLRLYGDSSDDKVVSFTEVEQELYVEYLAAKAARKVNEDEQLDYKNKLLAAFGEHSIGVMPDGTIVRRKKIDVAGYTKEVKPFSYFRLKEEGRE